MITVTGLAGPARGQIGSDRYSSIIVEAGAGTILSGVAVDEPRRPASLTKLMTLYLVFEALRDRRIGLEQPVPVSAHAASQSPTKLGLIPGTRITVEQAILGLVTKSANDAAAALGEMLGGDEDRFAQMMTLRARALGMSRTSFGNASGLPDPLQWSTARDMATLGRRILSDFPGYYGYFSTPSFVWRGRTFLNHDRLLLTYAGADGLKTGYTIESGYNLVTSAKRGGVRLIGVVMGAGSGSERDQHMAALLDASYDQLDIPSSPARTMQAARGFGIVATAQAASLSTRTSARAAQAGMGRGQAAPPARWGVQVGSFVTEKAARGAALAARRAADDGTVHVESATVRKKTIWRAQLISLTAAEAQSACASLARRKSPCMVLRPDQGQFASR